MYGDVEKVICDILRNTPAMAPYDPIGIGTDLIGYTSPARWLLVTRVGGEPTLWRQLDNPHVRIAAYGEDKGEALDLAIVARDVIFHARGSGGDGIELYDVDEDEGLQWSPDERDPTIPRYTFTLALVTRQVTT